MKPIRNFMWFCVGLLISAGLFFVPYAHAQMAPYPQVTGPFSPYPPQYNPYLPNPVTGAPSAISQATSAGVNATQSGTAVVKTAAGVRIPVPVSQTANVSKAAISQAARACFTSPAAAAACGAAAAAVAALAEKNICYSTVVPGLPYICGPDAPSPAMPPYPLESSGWYGVGTCTTQNTCSFGVVVEKLVLSGCGPGGKSPTYGAPFLQNGGVRTVNVQCRTASNEGPYGAGNANTLTNPPPYTSPVRPWTDSEVATILQQKMDADFANNRLLYDAMKKDEAANPNRDASLNPIKSDTPVSVNAPPVTSPERTVSETTIPKPDGSTDTKTVTEKTTVTPTTTGTTQGDTKTTYPSQTITTTTITNNVTNTTTTETNITNNLPAESEQEEEKDPCETSPDRAGCAKLGTPPVAEDIPTLDIPVSVTPVIFASSASCPPDLTYEAFGARNISYAPLCNKMSEVRPIFLALGAFASAIIVMGFFRI